MGTFSISLFMEVIMEYIIQKELSARVLDAAFAVHRSMGPGLLESAYEGAYAVELVSHGMEVARQVVYPLNYKGEYIGAYVADMVVENKIIVELKSVAKLNVVMKAQLLNYLRLSGLPVGYLINFCNTRLEWRRFVHTR
jgi:GxxExxY protein